MYADFVDDAVRTVRAAAPGDPSRVGEAAAVLAHATTSTSPARSALSFRRCQCSAQQGVGRATSNGTRVPPAAGCTCSTSWPSMQVGRTWSRVATTC